MWIRRSESRCSSASKSSAMIVIKADRVAVHIFTPMAGSKKSRQKKVDSTASDAPTAVPDDDLMDDLFSQLDSREQPVVDQGAEQPSAARTRLDPRSRFKARQVGARVPFHKASPQSTLGQKGCCVRTVAYSSRSRGRSKVGKGSKRGGERHQQNLPRVLPSGPRGM